ncbi:hypothetical protein [Rhizobium sp. SAFR-030]|uniref:hypothetical protein n=1 Tax=Rhizobium sp. SAFR-030 TaxID=3387277 RepID=UPI003F7D1C3F
MIDIEGDAIFAAELLGVSMELDQRFYLFLPLLDPCGRYRTVGDHDREMRV